MDWAQRRNFSFVFSHVTYPQSAQCLFSPFHIINSRYLHTFPRVHCHSPRPLQAAACCLSNMIIQTYLTVMWHKVTVRKILFSLKLTGLHPTCLWGPTNTLVVFETSKNGRKQARIEVGGNSVWSKSAI